LGTNFIWGSAIALEAVVLYRGVKAALLTRYPLFYAYVACVFLIELFRFSCHEFAPNLYQPVYWHTELVTIGTSYAVIFEILRGSLRHNPAVTRLARTLMLVVFVLTGTYVASDMLHRGFASLPRVTAELGRDLRYVEGALLLEMLWLFGRYRISFGRNLLGLAVGYSLLVGLDVISLAFLFLPGNEFSIGLRKLLPITYLITLSIWCASLWSFQPEPLPPSENAIDQDYELLATRTRANFAQVSARVGRILRP
jgi:hypothetical protein